MDATSNNPPDNKLPQGVTDAQILSAVSATGYPLQTLLASNLRRDFNRIQEQWSYEDRHTGEIRTLNLLTTKYFAGADKEIPMGKISPALTLLIECRQSALPYVFFLSLEEPEVPDFPLITGLPPLRLKRDDGAIWPNVSLSRALSLDRENFVGEAPYCATFSRCFFEGEQIRLTGSEPFNDLVLPLTKAMSHYEQIEAHRDEVSYLSHLVVGLAVLDAPMVGVKASEGSNEAKMMPWVRVARHETKEVKDYRRGGKLFAVDMVHKDFLRTYLDDHLLPFAEIFPQLVKKYRVALTSGEGRASGTEKRLV